MNQQIKAPSPQPRFNFLYIIGITVYVVITGSMLLYIVLPKDTLPLAFLGINNTSSTSQLQTTSKTPLTTPRIQNPDASTKQPITYTEEQVTTIKTYMKGSTQLSPEAQTQLEQYITLLANNGIDIYAMIQTLQKELNCTTADACRQLCASSTTATKKCEAIMQQYGINDNTGFQTTLNKTNDSIIKNDLANLEKALTCYYTNHQQYPTMLSLLIPDCITTLPTNPYTDEPYTYTATTRGFSLQATLSTQETITVTQEGESVTPMQ